MGHPWATHGQRPSARQPEWPPGPRARVLTSSEQQQTQEQQQRPLCTCGLITTAMCRSSHTVVSLSDAWAPPAGGRGRSAAVGRLGMRTCTASPPCTMQEVPMARPATSTSLRLIALLAALGEGNWSGKSCWRASWSRCGCSLAASTACRTTTLTGGGALGSCEVALAVAVAAVVAAGAAGAWAARSRQPAAPAATRRA